MSDSNTPTASIITISAQQAGQRIDNFLQKQLKGVPRSHVYRLLRSGQVRVNSGRKKAHYKLQAGDRLRLPPVRSRRDQEADIPPGVLQLFADNLIHDDEQLLAINKPAGFAVHKGSGLRYGVIEVMRRLYPDANLELVHRLDRDTSGVLLLAKNRQILNTLHSLLRQEQDSRIEKSYLALLAGRWQGGSRRVDAPLAKIRRGGEHMMQVARDGDHAVSHFHPLEVFTDCSLVEVRIETGRTHQIRVHAQHLGHPVAGDSRYGDRDFNRRLRKAGLKRLFLHAQRLSLPLPDPLTIEAPLAAGLDDFLTRLSNTHRKDR